MDDIDRTLISLLREDARASVSSLAVTCRVSRGTVQNRIGRLVNRGTIQASPSASRPRPSAARCAR